MARFRFVAITLLALAALGTTTESAMAQRGGRGGGGGSRGGSFNRGGFNGGYNRGGYYGGGFNRGFYGGGLYGLGLYSGLYGRGLYGAGFYPGYRSGGYYPGYGYGSYSSGYGYAAPVYVRTYVPVVEVPPTTSLSYNPEVSDTRAHVRVMLPQDAELTINGEPATMTGRARDFTSPALSEGQMAAYDLKARWVLGGETVERTRHIEVAPGQSMVVGFLPRAKK